MSKESSDDLFKDSSGHMKYHFKKSPFDILSQKLGPKYVEYRKQWIEAGDQKIITEYPLHINFAVKDKCNFRCKSCILSLPVSERNFKAAKGYTSKEEFYDIVKEGVKHGLKSLDFGIISEPLLIPDLPEYVRIAKDLGVIDIMFTTNGSLLDEEMSVGLIKNGLTWLAISLDAFSKETYENLRVGGDYDVVMNNLLNFLEIKKSLGSELPITRVSFLKMKENIDELPAFEEFWTDRVDVVSVQSLVNTHYGYESSDDLVESLLLEDEQHPDYEDLSLCSYPYQRMVVRGTGDILPCCSFHGYEFIIGNIKNDSLYDLWNSDKFKQLRKQINAPKLEDKPLECQKCIKARIHEGY